MQLQAEGRGGQVSWVFLTGCWCFLVRPSASDGRGLVFFFEEDSIGLWLGVVVLDTMDIFQVLDLTFRYLTDPEGLHSVSRDQTALGGSD